MSNRSSTGGDTVFCRGNRVAKFSYKGFVANILYILYRSWVNMSRKKPQNMNAQCYKKETLGNSGRNGA